MSIIRKIRKTGKTLSEFAIESGITLERLVGIVERRRRISPEEVGLISRALSSSEQNIKDDLEVSQEDLKTFVEYCEREGSFPDFSQAGSFKTSIIHAMNDLYRDILSESPGLCYSQSEEEVTERMKELVLSRQIRKGIVDNTDTRKIPVSFYERGQIVSCWIELVDAKHTVDQRNTVIIEGVTGISPVNAPWQYLSVISQTLLIPMRWCTPVECQDTWPSNIRFLVKYTMKEKYRYMEMVFNDNELRFVDTNFYLRQVDVLKERRYRRIIPARELPAPFENRDAGRRCSEDRIGACPLVEENVPDNNNGCTRCYGMALVWNARSWLLERVPDEKLEVILNLSMLEAEHKEVYEEFVLQFKDSTNDLNHLYSLIYQYGSYCDGYLPIDVSEYGYTDGSHRTQMARILDHKIPVHWTTTEKLSYELID